MMLKSKTFLSFMSKILRRQTRENWEEVDKITQSVIEITETVVSKQQPSSEKYRIKVVKTSSREKKI